MQQQKAQSWKQKVIEADKIWHQVKQILDAGGIEMPETPRRPDVRLIVNNRSGMDMTFANPGDHSSMAEHIPASGDKTAAMVMMNGATLREQYENAAALVQLYDLAREGLSRAFVQAIGNGGAGGRIKEAYGPAPFADQAERLVDLQWKNTGGGTDVITPVRAEHCAYGTRAAAGETAFLTEIVIFVKGSTTTPEMLENAEMVIAVSKDWQTGRETTRPIVPSVAKEFYGRHFDTMPVASLHPDGRVMKIDMKNGTVIDIAPPKTYAAPGAGLS